MAESKDNSYFKRLIFVLMLVQMVDSFTTVMPGAIVSSIANNFLPGIPTNEQDAIYAFGTAIISIGMCFLFFSQYLSDRLGRRNPHTLLRPPSVPFSRSDALPGYLRGHCTATQARSPTWTPAMMTTGTTTRTVQWPTARGWLLLRGGGTTPVRRRGRAFSTRWFSRWTAC